MLSKLTLAGLQEKQAAIIGEFKRRVTLATSDPWATCKGQEHVKRALIVAAVCKPRASVLLIGPPGVGKSLLVACGYRIGLRAVWEAWACPCGALDTERTCKCTATQVARHRAAKIYPLLRTTDMIVSVYRATAEQLRSKWVSFSEEQAIDRVVEARGYEAVWTDDGSHGARDMLLSQAIRELSLSAARIETIKRISRACARLAGRDTANTGDVVEAWHYCPRF